MTLQNEHAGIASLDGAARGAATGSVGESAVSVIVPVFNEEEHIEACLDSLIQQVQPGQGEVIVVDGGSTDRTKELVLRHQAYAPQLRLLDNPQRIQAAGVNLAVAHADPRVKWIIRADAHSEYPPDFVTHILEALAATGASSVVVPMRAVGRSGFQRGVAAVQNSRLGTGGAAHRMGTRSGYVDHGHHAGFRREMFERIGGYDTRFTHNEDAEYDLRVHKAGGHIWMCCEATINYFPRKTAGGLARQYYLFGMGRMRTFLLHHQRPRLRQVAPIAVLLANGFGVGMSILVPALGLIPVAYVALCCGWSSYLAIKAKDPWVLSGSMAAPVMHHSWAVGALRELVRRFVARRKSDRLQAKSEFAD